jgi:hypothetical protein
MAGSGYGAGVSHFLPRLSRVLREDLDQCERSTLASWLAFTTTFGAVRGITYSIRAGRGPFRNLSVGGEHLHHYMWGIGLLAGVGAVAVRGSEKQRRHPAVAISYGTGLALIVDEFALLLDLKDVYWAKQGRVSVDLGVGGIAAVGSCFAALPVVRALRHDHEADEAGRTGEAGEANGAGEAAGTGEAASASRSAGADKSEPGSASA